MHRFNYKSIRKNYINYGLKSLRIKIINLVNYHMLSRPLEQCKDNIFYSTTNVILGFLLIGNILRKQL